MKNTLLFLFVVTGCGPLPVGESEEAVLGTTTGGVAQRNILGLSVTSVEPTTPVELRPTFLRFQLDNSTPVARTGRVQAVVMRSDGTTFSSSTWNLSVAAYTKASGIVSFDAPIDRFYYSLHYYDSSAPNTPAEASACAGWLEPKRRFQYRIDDLIVGQAANPQTGDRVTVELSASGSEFADGSEEYWLHTHDEVWPGGAPIWDLGPREDVVFFADLFDSTSWPANRLIEVRYETWSSTFGDVVAQLTPGVPVTQRSVYDGPNGAHYIFDTAAERIARAADTIDTPSNVLQVHSNETVAIAQGSVWATVSGVGSTTTFYGWLCYQAPAVSAPTEVKVNLSGAGRLATTIYIQVLP
jgi:hypothetical protein